MRKFLGFLKDFWHGLLYLGLMAGFMLLVASAMYYFKPHEIFIDATAPVKAKQSDIALAMQLLKWGLKLALGCIAALWASLKIEALWRKRRKKQAAAEAAAAPEAAAAK